MLLQDSEKWTLRTIVIKNVNQFCYIVQNFHLKHLVLKLWFVYILLTKLHVNVTKHLQSPLYLCLVLSGCVKHGSKSPCGNYLLRDNTLTHYLQNTMSMWSQFEKSKAAWIHLIRNILFLMRCIHAAMGFSN